MSLKSFNYMQNGAAIVETVLVFIPLSLMAALLIELAHSQSVGDITQLAIYQAARAASLAGAQPEVADQAFSQAITPLYLSAEQQPERKARHDPPRKNTLTETGLRLWQIEMTNPDIKSFTDFAQVRLSAIHKRPTLDNNYLSEQHEANIRKGWAEGRGPVSGQTVFDANTLRLEVSLLYKPRAPGIGTILKVLGARRSDRTGTAWQQGYLVANRYAEIMMQSDAISQATTTHAFHRTFPLRHTERYTPRDTSRVLVNNIVKPTNRPQPFKEMAPPQQSYPELNQPKLRELLLMNKNELAQSAMPTEQSNVCEGLICCQSH